LEIKKTNQCPICLKQQVGGQVCQNCQGDSWLDGLWVAADYRQPVVQRALQLFKYQLVAEIKEVFDCLLAEHFKINPAWQDNYLLVPVPLHCRRQRWRGFNQAELIARIISKIKGNQLANQIIARKIYHQPQVGLRAEARKKNVRGVFTVNLAALEDVKQKPVVLIDDVYTTGATMQECAKVLKQAGCKSVWGLVLARG
jgi:ComF family protein